MKATICDCCQQVNDDCHFDDELEMDFCADCLRIVQEIYKIIYVKAHAEMEKRTVEYGLAAVKSVDVVKLADWFYTNAKDEYTRLFGSEGVTMLKQAKGLLT